MWYSIGQIEPREDVAGNERKGLWNCFVQGKGILVKPKVRTKSVSPPPSPIWFLKHHPWRACCQLLVIQKICLPWNLITINIDTPSNMSPWGEVRQIWTCSSIPRVTGWSECCLFWIVALYQTGQAFLSPPLSNVTCTSNISLALLAKKHIVSSMASLWTKSIIGLWLAFVTQLQTWCFIEFFKESKKSERLETTKIIANYMTTESLISPAFVFWKN